MDENSIPSEVRKAEIRAEEIYRRAVLDQLEQSRTPKSLFGRATKFFQTSFGVFVASSLLLPLCLWAYSAAQSHYAMLDYKQKLTTQLDAEISLRIRLTSAYLCDGALDKFIYEFSNTSAIYPEFRGINSLGLFMLLADNLPETERTPVIKAMDALAKPTKAGLVVALETRNWSKSPCLAPKP